MFNFCLFCLLLCPQYCGAHKKKNYQGLDEWILVAFFSFHFNPAAIEVHESYFYLFPGLIIHMHQCHLLSPSHKDHIKGLTAPCILGLYVLASAVSSAWEMSGSHLLWHTSMGQFQCPTFDILWRSSSSEYLRAICIPSSLVPPPITAVFRLFTFSPSFSY